MTPDPHPWAAELDSLHAQVWTRLQRGVRDRHAPARHPTLATVGANGMPQIRTVVLRAALAQEASLDIHTDLRSAKVAELRASPLAGLHIWDASAHLQIRLETAATILTGHEVLETWQRVPDASRVAYGTMPPPGAPISHALAYEKPPDAASFAVVRLQVLAMDVVHLGPNHRRARFERADNWAGQWLAP